MKVIRVDLIYGLSEVNQKTLIDMTEFTNEQIIDAVTEFNSPSQEWNVTESQFNALDKEFGIKKAGK